jgi:hypothetical protein
VISKVAYSKKPNESKKVAKDGSAKMVAQFQIEVVSYFG